MESKSEDETYRQAIAEAEKAACIEYANSFFRFTEKRAYWQSVLKDEHFPNENEGDHEAELSKSMLMIEHYERYYNTGDPYLLM